MKVPPRSVSGFCSAPPSGVVGVLIYGPNDGLVRELSRRIREAIVDDLSDPFRTAEFSGAALKDEPSLLHDEAMALSLTGGRRVIRVTEPGEAAADAARILLDGSTSEGALAVFEAGALTPRSGLRKLFERADNAAALACYDDEARDTRGLIESFFGSRGIAVEIEAIGWLGERLGGDRAQINAELEKIALFVGDAGTIAFDDLQTLVGDVASLSLDDLCMAVGQGNPGAVDRALQRAFDDGVASVQALRAVSRHFLRLQLASARVAEGASIDQAMGALRPPVFFKQKDNFARQVRHWAPTRLSDALVLLGEAEAACKSTGAPSQALCSRALFSVASAARQRAAPR